MGRAALRPSQLAMFRPIAVLLALLPSLCSAGYCSDAPLCRDGLMFVPNNIMYHVRR